MLLLGIMGDDMDFASPLKFVKISSTLQDSIGVNAIRSLGCMSRFKTGIFFFLETEEPLWSL